MAEVSIRNLRPLIQRAEASEEIIILRYSKAVARLVSPKCEPKEFPDLTEFRASIEIREKGPHEALTCIREEYRYWFSPATPKALV
jgi:antitoxin (DNA-binding transcriptional repressor) of toxin-antitoxin stability system